MVSVKGCSWKPCESQSFYLHQELGLPPQEGSSYVLRSPSPFPLLQETPPSPLPDTEERPPSADTLPRQEGTEQPGSTGTDLEAYLLQQREQRSLKVEQEEAGSPPPGTDNNSSSSLLRSFPLRVYDDPLLVGGPATESPSEAESASEVCAITTEERLLKTNPIWFLADLQRKGAVHLLQGKDEGSFLVRQSSQSNTLAISVRLPPDKGPHVQHYLVEIQPQGQYSLEASDNRFNSLPSLLAYYTTCSDELPVKLKLPKCVSEAKTRHELASIALLGQEFWGTPLASPCSPSVTSPPPRPNDLSFSSFGKSTSSVPHPRMGILHQQLSPSVESLTPSRPAPPVPIDRSSLNLNLSSLEEVLRDTNPVSAFSSFKGGANNNNNITPLTPMSKPVPPPRLSPPTKPPAPPLRNSPCSTGSSSTSSEASHSPSNITVTTTLTFNVNQVKGLVPLSLNGVSSSSPNSSPSPHEETFQLHVSSLEISPSSKEGLRLHFRPPSYSSPPSQPPTPLTPLSEKGSEGKGGGGRIRRSRGKRKDPAVDDTACHRSSLADKISDYEDLWTSPLPQQEFPPPSAAEDPREDESLTVFSGSTTSFKPRTDISRSLGDLSDVMRREAEEQQKPSSPFYVEPLDALREEGEAVKRTGGGRKCKGRRAPRKGPSNRHSDSNIEWRHRRTRRSTMADPSHEDDLSSSQEDADDEAPNNNNNNNSINNGNRRPKAVPPPKVNGKDPINWVDASWEFLTYVGTSQGEALTPGALTAQALIEQRLPHLAPGTETSSSLRHSAYDNVSGRTSSFSDSGTEFSEPWDSRKWDSLLNEGSRNGSDSPESLVQVTGDSESNESEDDRESNLSSSGPVTLSLSHKTNNFDTNLRSKILSPQMLALRHRKDAESGAAVRRYALALGHDAATTFSQAVRNFLTCTLEGSEREAAVVVRNVRQFMSGMKNYLVTSGEGEFEAIVTRERSNLKSNEFLNLDAILEDVLVRLVLRPLWTHINQLSVDALTTDGSIQRLADNISYAKTIADIKLGIREELLPPKGAALEAIRMLLKKMQHVYAPREKLGHLLGVISHIYHAMYENGGCVPSTGDADDLVPMLMWVISRCNFLSAEVEADYLQGLLLPSSAGGEASYYLSAFHSAIHSLKNLQGETQPQTDSLEPRNNAVNDGSRVSTHGVLRVLVPDEKNGSIATRTLPIRPGSTARELCRMMAHKLRVTNPQDFALYKLIDGNESVLGDNECPQKIRDEFTKKGSHCLIAFKRIDAKIAWPLIN